ncbi:amidohydrolase family protein [Salinibacillus aidingensis]|uniref:Amidohydrolase family protein n=1 Tax=Salinibacillus aidingensis TaxID=237684 RepID=A0ABN1B921_9BACI
MYRTMDGEEIFIIDAHIALWDASKENQLNVHGQQFIDCFYDYQTSLSPQEFWWDKEDFLKYSEDRLIKDVFHKGYADMAIFQPVLLKEFYKNGFGDIENSQKLTQTYPNRLICNDTFDPRHGKRGLEELEKSNERYSLKGVKLYTADWYGDSKGYKLSDDSTYRYLEKCQELGIKNIHIHKGPTITPLNRDAFDVADVDDAATSFPELNFIVEHLGLPRLEDFCWIATQEKNVYGGLSVAMPFIYARPRYFAEIMGELLFWLDEDRIIFGSDYAIWEPGWLIEKFMEFELPEDIKQETGAELNLDVKKKILAGNAARLYDIDIEAQKGKINNDRLAQEMNLSSV